MWCNHVMQCNPVVNSCLEMWSVCLVPSAMACMDRSIPFQSLAGGVATDYTFCADPYIHGSSAIVVTLESLNCVRH